MNSKLIKLYDQLLKYEEAEELRRVIAANSYPIMLKIAQEQLKLFEESEEIDQPEDEPTDFSFQEFVGKYGLDNQGAEFLDLLVKEIVKAHPERAADELVENIKRDFFQGTSGGRGYYYGDWTKTNHEKLKKYIALAPSIAWTPTEHQQSLPFKEIPVSLPLGGSPDEVRTEKRDQELAKKINDEVLRKEEYRPLLMPYYDAIQAAGGYKQHSDLIKKKEEELKERLKENNISEKYLTLHRKEEEFVYRADVIEEARRDLEKRWHKLKADNDLLESEIESLEPGSITVRSPDEINTHEELVYSIAEYATWASKLFISQHFDYRPIFDKRWNRTGPTSGWVDISDLQNLLEFDTRSADPLIDYHKKSEYMNKMEQYCSSVLNNIRTWKSIFKKIDKKLISEVQNKMSELKPQDIRLYRWVEKFKPEVIKKSYSEYISKIASNIPSESNEFPVGFENVDIKGLADITAFDFSNLFLKKKTQTDLMSHLSTSVFRSLNSIGAELLTNLHHKIEAHLFNLSKNTFENKYFKMDVALDDNGNIKRTYNADDIPIVQIRAFINDWSGKPNLRSFENVILSLTKDPSYVNDFYEIQSNKFSSYFQTGYYALFDVIVKFISKLKVGSEEEILRAAEEQLFSTYYSEVMNDAAKQIASKLSDSHETIRYGTVRVGSKSFATIAPNLNSKRFETITERYAHNLSASSLLNGIKNITYHLEDDIKYRSSVGSLSFQYSDEARIIDNIRKNLPEIHDSERSLLKPEFLNSIEKSLNDVKNIASNIQFSPSPEYYKEEDVDTLLVAINELRKISKFGKFIKQSETVTKAFGGVGFKDISSGIDALFTETKIEGVSKKEFIQMISQYISGAFSEKELPSAEKEHIEWFLDSIQNGNFKKYISKIINALELKNTKQILATVESANSRLKSLNVSEEDLVKSIRVIKLQGMTPQAASERWIKSASFIHNHASIPMNYIKTLINSPNFLSDTKISKEFIENCTKIYLAGGINNYKIPEEGSKEITKGTIVKGLLTAGLVSDKAEFYRILNAFSRLCANKDGVRPNLGNGTAEMKLSDWLAENMMEYINDTPGWNNMDFDAKTKVVADNLKESYVGLTEEEVEDSIRVFYERTIKKIVESASTKEQYEKDLKIKSLIQMASSSLKLIEDSAVMLKYAEDAKKKDPRLFNFQLNFPNMPFRFRVLKDLDPYHFSVGADTNCCQRIGGVGAAAAIDSFINPLAGVLLLESNAMGEWVTLSQSYFHFVPNSNGVILDNVEWNSSNIFNIDKKIPFDINQLYATFAEHIKEKNNLNYVRCGTEYNKLKNSMFSSGRIVGGDPRHIEHGAKYSDFSSSSHIDLLKPKFDVKIKIEDKKAMSIYSKLIKIAYKLPVEERQELFDIYFA